MGGRLVVDEEVAVGDLEGREARGAGADDGGGPVRVGEGALEPRLLDRLVGGGRGEPRVAVGICDALVALGPLEPRAVIEILDLGGDQDLQVLERETAESADAGLAPLHAGPEFIHGMADGRHYAHAGDDDTSRAVRGCHLWTRSWVAISVNWAAARTARRSSGKPARLS